MLGNVQRESTLNPGLKETVSVSSGWGLIQWTPSSNLTDYANAQGKDWKDGKLQCQLINAKYLRVMATSGNLLKVIHIVV